VIIFVGLVLALCLAGAWLALTLDGKAPQNPPYGPQEPSAAGEWWSQVEAGPDSLDPNGSDRGTRS
jgi:hypothetical protein